MKLFAITTTWLYKAQFCETDALQKISNEWKDELLGLTSHQPLGSSACGMLN